MLKHSNSSLFGRNGCLETVPGVARPRKDDEVVGSNCSVSSSSSSASDSSRISKTTHSHTAKTIWDRYTNSRSELRKGSSLTKGDSFLKPGSLPTGSKLIANVALETSALENSVISGESGDVSRHETEVKDDSFVQHTVVNIPDAVKNSSRIPDESFSLIKKIENNINSMEKDGRKWFGLVWTGLCLLIILSLVILIVLMILTTKARVVTQSEGIYRSSVEDVWSFCGKFQIQLTPPPHTHTHTPPLKFTDPCVVWLVYL